MKDFKILKEGAIKPVRKTSKAAGYDFYTLATVVIPPLKKVSIPTGIGTDGMLDDEVLILKLRSSAAENRPLVLEGGVVDADFENTGEDISIILLNHSPNIPVTIDKGTRIAQGIIIPFRTTENEKKPTTKRVGGKGSTGTK